MGYRGMYKAVPVLMAMGVAGVVSFMAYKSWRLVRDRNVRGPFLQLKRDGRPTFAGIVFAILSVAVVAIGLQGVAINAAIRRGEDLYSRITVQSNVVFSRNYAPTPQNKALAEEAIACYRFAGPIARSGISFSSTFEQNIRLAWLSSVAGDRTAGEAALMRALVAAEPGTGSLPGLIQFFQLRSAPREEAEATLNALLKRWPESDIVRSQLVGIYMNSKRSQLVAPLYAERLKEEPGDIAAVNSAAIYQLRLEQPAEALAIVQEGLKHRPKSALLHERLAQTMLVSGRDQAKAAEELRFAAEKEPTFERWNILSQLYHALGREADAETAASRARALSKPGQQAPDSGGDIPSATK
jgi:hypothetical protein